MKTTSTAYLFILLMLFSLTSCFYNDIDGEGPIVSQKLDLASFESVDFQNFGEVTIIQGAEQSVIVTSQRNIIERLNTRVVNGTWEISLDHGRYDYNKMSITIVIPNIKDVLLSGSGTITLDDFEVQNNIEFLLAGSGKININKVSGSAFVEAEVVGSGSIIANRPFIGLTQLNIDIHGSGNFSGFQMAADICNVNIIGSGRAEVYALNNLDVDISGSGSVFYRGNPRISTSITGSGSIIDSN